MNHAMPAQARRTELAHALSEVRGRIARACQNAGRSESEVTLIVVTKTFPASDVIHLAGLGVRDVGENRDQEAAVKADEVRAAGGAAAGLRWHFVGQLQRNKAASVARYADVVHSVDRVPLVRALSRGAQAADRTVGVLIQVNLDDVPDPGRGGAAPADVGDVAHQVGQAPGLVLRGVMGVAPRVGDPRPAFERLAGVSARLRDEHPQAQWISAGMSGDFEVALACGATHLRVGGAVLGSRPSLR